MLKQNSTCSPAFRQAMTDGVLEQFSDIPDREEAIDLRPTDGLLARIEEGAARLLRRQRAIAAAKRTAFVLVLALGLTSTALAIPPVRQVLEGFLSAQDRTHFALELPTAGENGVPGTVETLRLPGYLPEGFQGEQASITDASASYTWSGKDGSFLSYIQMVVPDADAEHGWFGLDAESSDGTYLTLGGTEVYLQQKDDSLSLFWTDGTYAYSLISGGLPQSELERVFYSVGPAQAAD